MRSNDKLVPDSDRSLRNARTRKSCGPSLGEAAARRSLTNRSCCDRPATEWRSLRRARELQSSVREQLRPADGCDVEHVRHTHFCDRHSGGSLRRDATSRRELRAFAAESCGPPIPRGIDPAPCDDVRKPAAGSAIESHLTRQQPPPPRGFPDTTTRSERTAALPPNRLFFH